MDGIINLNKPAGMTSMSAISCIRRLFSEKKAGHIGTLDPDVTGVLPIFAGKATRAIHYIQDGDKIYNAELTLGITTDTQDGSGAILSKKSCNYTQQEVCDALMSFVGDYVQIPPMYSAKKINGVKLVDLARQGIEIERREHPVVIRSIEIFSTIYNDDGTIQVKFDVTCSRGTYIRTLCHDVGEKLGCGGYMSYLQRTKSCGFSIANSVTLEVLTQACANGDYSKYIMPIDHVFGHLQRINLNESNQIRFLKGFQIRLRGAKKPGLSIVYGFEGDFIGLCMVTQQEGFVELKIERQFVV